MRVSLVLVPIVLLLVPIAAAAQAAGAERAFELFQESETAFDAGDLDRAGRLLEEAFSLHHESALLFNLGRVRDAQEDHERALSAYLRYVELTPHGPRSSEARARITELRAASQEARAQPRDVEIAPPVEGPAEPVLTPTVEPRSESSVSWAGVATLTSGIALLLGGGGLAILAQVESDRAAAPATFMREAADARDLAVGSGAVSIGLLGAGGVLLVTGIILLATEDGSQTLEVSVGPNSLSLSGVF